MERQPLLFMRMGIPYAEPNHFYFKLAKHYDAVVHNPTVIKRSARDSKLHTRTMSKREVTQEMERLTRESLGDREHVLFDTPLYVRSRRNQVRAIAEATGARAILLSMDAPGADIAERILATEKRRELPDALSNPGAVLNQAIRTVNRTRGRIERPLPEEQYLALNGLKSADELLRQVIDYVGE